jgi:hypothetical protein
VTPNLSPDVLARASQALDLTIADFTPWEESGLDHIQWREALSKACVGAVTAVVADDLQRALKAELAEVYTGYVRESMAEKNALKARVTELEVTLRDLVHGAEMATVGLPHGSLRDRLERLTVAARAVLAEVRGPADD